MRLTELVEREDDGKWRCGVCQWRCSLAVGETGRCLVRAATAEGIEALNHGMISAANFGPIEDHRLWHFFPDTQVLAIGGWVRSSASAEPKGWARAWDATTGLPITPELDHPRPVRHVALAPDGNLVCTTDADRLSALSGATRPNVDALVDEVLGAASFAERGQVSRS